MPLSCTVRAGSFSSLEGGWRELLPRSPTNTIFSTPEWARSWWQEFGEGKELWLRAVECGSNLVGIAPLIAQGDVVSFMGGPDLCDYLDFVPFQGQEGAFYPAVWEHLRGCSWRSLDLHCLASGSPTLSHLPAQAQASGCTVEQHLEEVCPRVELPQTWEEYLASLNKKRRHELRRKLRRLTEQGFSYYATQGQLPSAQDITDFFRLYSLSGPEKARFMTPQRAHFFQALLSGALGPDRLKLYFLEVGGVRVSTALCFDQPAQRLLYNSGYDPDFSWLSVGLLLKALCLKDAIASGKRQMDFLRGAEPYKYDLGAQDRPLYRLVIRRD